MSVLVALAVGAGIGAVATYGACLVHYDAQRTSHHFHEQDSHTRGDAAWRLAGRVDRWINQPELGARVLERANRLRTGTRRGWQR